MNKEQHNPAFIKEIDNISIHHILRDHKKRRIRKIQLQQSFQKFKNIQNKNPFLEDQDLRSIREVVFSERIKPRKFVFHLSKPENRDFILNFGLQTTRSRTKAIFANNQDLSDYSTFFPFCLNEGDPLDLDIWQIDTVKAKVDWQIDPFMDDDDRYICTTEDITPVALRLFKAFVTKAGTTSLRWMDLGSLKIDEFRFEEHLPRNRRCKWY